MSSCSAPAAVAIDALGEAAERARAAAGRSLWSRNEVGHEDMYVGGGALSALTAALEEIAGHLA